MKYKKYIIGFVFGLLVLVGGGVSASANTGSIGYVAPNFIATLNGALHWYLYTPDNNIYYDSYQNVTNSPQDLGIAPDTYKWIMTDETVQSACTDNGYDACILASVNPTFGTVIIPAVTPTPSAGAGISFFKSGGTYQASNMIGQTATAIQSTMGLNGIGPMLAIVAGISMALMIGLWISDIFGETKKGLKEVDKKKE